MHFARREYAGIFKLLDASEEKLREFAPEMFGVDVDGVLEGIARVRQEFETLGPERFTEWDERLLPPAAHEPMFAVLRQRGYDWRHANMPLAPTGRAGPGGDIGRLYKRLWFLTRGLVCDEPAIVPAVDGAGRPMGSHDAISVRIRLA